MPYLNVTASSSTSKALNPDRDDKNVYTLKEYVKKVRRLQNIFVDFSINGNTLNVDIVKKAKVTRKIDFSDTSYKLLDEAYSREAVGRITSVCEEDSSTLEWYLLTDGTVTSAYTADNRVEGEWITLFILKLADVEDRVLDEFEKTKYSHLIEFSSKKELDFLIEYKFAYMGKC